MTARFEPECFTCHHLGRHPTCERTSALLLFLSVAAFPAAASDATSACVSDPGLGGIDVTCTITSAPTDRTLRFKADPVGSHDDIVLAMTATLDDAPLVCDAGGKTRLVGEDGEVSLDCGFTVPAGVAERFGAHVTDHHDQYIGKGLAVQ